LGSGAADRSTTPDAGRCERLRGVADGSSSGADGSPRRRSAESGDVIGAPLATDEGGGGTGVCPGAAGLGGGGATRDGADDALDCDDE
jgi:hypothetical protein